MKLMSLLHLLWLPYVCLSQSAPDEKKSPPEVFALIIGVNDYGGNAATASKADTGAIAFAKAVRETYGDSSVKHLLINSQATLRNVNAALREINKLPPASLAIIYFAGHAHREQYSSGSTLFLRLHGSTAESFDDTSIQLPMLWNPLKNTKLTNAMIFVDACYAGSETEEIITESELNNANVRAFAMCACASNESAVGDTFTNALLATWRSAHRENTPCTRLEEFEERVKEEVAKHNSFMSPGIAFKTRIARCLTQMTQPSSLLAFTFPKGCKAGVTFTFNSKVVERGFSYSRDKIFVSQVSLNEPVHISVKGPENVDLIAPIVIHPLLHMPKRIIEIEVSVPDKYAALGKSDTSAAALKLAEIVEAYGENPHEHYAAAARALHREESNADTSWMIAKASTYEPANEMYAFAAGKRSLSKANLNQYLLSPLSAINDIESLEEMGANTAAAELGIELSKRLPSKDDFRVPLLVRALGNLKIAGVPEDDSRHLEAQQLLVKPSTPSIPGTRMAVTTLQNTTPETLSRRWPRTPRIMLDWGSPLLQTTDALAHDAKDIGVSIKYISNLLTVDDTSTKDKAHSLFQKRLYLATIGTRYSLVNDRDKLILRLRGTLNEANPAGSKWKIDVKGTAVTFYAPSEWDALRFSLSRAGFDSFVTDGSCLISRTNSLAVKPETAVRFKQQGSKYTLVAADWQTAVEYTCSKPGYSANFRGGTNWIIPAGFQGSLENPHFETQSDDNLGTWCNAFPSETNAKEYRRSMGYPSALVKSK